MTDSGNVPPPATGHPELDVALARLADLETRDVAEHHDLLAEAHQILQRLLETTPE